jgi:hypothetical protein
MIPFKNFLFDSNYVILEDAHMKTHLSHLEDLAIEGGKTGFRDFSAQIAEIIKKLQGFETSQQVNAKIDGSPMILFGFDPRPQYQGQFFISTKSGLNPNNPKIAHSQDEIQEFYGQNPELAKKLNNLLMTLRKAYDGSNKIYQGDVLFGESADKKMVKIGEEDFIAFKPNVIVYAVPVDPESELSKHVQRASVGVIVHESFRGIPINDDKAIRLESLGRNIDSLIQSSKNTDAFIESSNYGKLTVDVPDKYFDDINQLLLQAKNNINSISKEFDQQYLTSDIMDYLKIFLNKQVDLGENGFFGQVTANKDVEFDEFIEDFKRFLTDRFKIEQEKKKTEKGRQSVEARLNQLLSFVESNRSSIIGLLEATKDMLKIKNILLQIFSNLDSKVGKTFIQQPDGSYTKTKDEGYVLFVGTNHVKIVDRLDFTKTNRAFGGKKRTAIIS